MDLNRRLFVNAPVFTQHTRHVVLDANGVAGTAEDLFAEIVARHDALYTTDLWTNYGQRVIGLWLCNCSADTAYIRGSEVGAAATADGLPIAENDRVYLPLHGWPADSLLYESTGNLSVFFITEG